MKELSLFILLGVVDPACTLQQVCTPGYTSTVRPPQRYTNQLKREQMLLRGLPGDPGQYEEDHVIPLELCGAPRDPSNLTPEPWKAARIKDVYETRFHRAVCAGTMRLKDAQRQIVRYE